MDRDLALATLAALHAAQNAMYAGGDPAQVRDLLTGDIEWHVPGDNPIAGVHRGRDAVIAYFLRRRELASNTFRLHPGDVLVGEGDHVAAPVHDRMPVILAGPDEEAAWLSGELDPPALTELLVPLDAARTSAAPANPAVNRAGVEGPELIEPPAEAPEPAQLTLET